MSYTTSPPSSSSGSGPLNILAPSTNFDIIAHYNALLKREKDLSPPLAAIESLTALLSENPLTTIAETLALLEAQSNLLTRSQRNPVPVEAGSDLFRRYIVSSFQSRTLLQHSDFTALRKHLISQTRLFIQRAKNAAPKIALHARPFIKDNAVLFTYDSSKPVIGTLLSSLSDANANVSVAHITTSSSSSPSAKTPPSSSMPSTTLPIHELAYALSSLLPSQLQHAIFIVSASAVLENGGIIAPLGTQQLAMLAHAHNIPFYVAAESFKFVREFPLGCGADDLAKMGVRQPTLGFSTGEASRKDATKVEEDGKVIREEGEKVDVTAPYLISALITENGTMTPSAVSEELVKLWY